MLTSGKTVCLWCRLGACGGDDLFFLFGEKRGIIKMPHGSTRGDSQMTSAHGLIVI